MKHGKRLLSLILVAMLVLGMTACGGEKTASSAPVEAGAVENTPEAPKESAVEVPEMPGGTGFRRGIYRGTGGAASGGQLSAV